MTFHKQSFDDYLETASAECDRVLELGQNDVLPDVLAKVNFSVWRGYVTFASLSLGNREFNRAEIREWLGDAQVKSLDEHGEQLWSDGIAASHYDSE